MPPRCLKAVAALMRRSIVTAVCLLVASCADGGATPDGPSGVAVAPVGSVDSMLVGELRACRQEDSCNGGACYRGICTGLVDADALWLQQQLGDRLLARVEGDPAALGDLLTKLESIALAPTRVPLVRSRAVAFAGRIADPRATALLQSASGETAPSGRLRALLALAGRGQADAVAPLSALVDDPSESVRVELAHALGPVGTDESVALLRQMADTDDAAAVRIAAVRALGQGGTAAARAALDAVVAEGPGYLRHDAVMAIRGMAAE